MKGRKKDVKETKNYHDPEEKAKINKLDENGTEKNDICANVDDDEATSKKNERTKVEEASEQGGDAKKEVEVKLPTISLIRISSKSGTFVVQGKEKVKEKTKKEKKTSDDDDASETANNDESDASAMDVDGDVVSLDDTEDDEEEEEDEEESDDNDGDDDSGSKKKKAGKKKTASGKKRKEE